ncbi:MAG: chemotaxis protein CheB [Bacteroidota bacterium]|nr:chemotaxis protein CheB [Bacteroidota bacterium]
MNRLHTLAADPAPSPLERVGVRRVNDFAIVLIGSSKGGLAALQKLLGFLPATFKTPVVIVQHRMESAEDLLVELLQKNTELYLKEVEDKDIINRGVIYLAPAGYHLLIEEDHFALSTEGPVSASRPSIDVLFESAAEEFGSKVVGIILTGMNRDGAQGLKKIKEAGGITLVQDPEEAEARQMPDAAIAASKVDYILALEGIGRFLNSGGAAPFPFPPNGGKLSVPQ